MFHWNAELYMDDKVKRKPARYRRIVEGRKIAGTCYCITLPANEKNCMDIYSSRQFWFRYYRELDIEIIGLAADREGARQVICQMAQDIIRDFGEMNAESVKAYFCAEKEGEDR